MEIWFRRLRETTFWQLSFCDESHIFLVRSMLCDVCDEILSIYTKMSSELSPSYLSLLLYK
jgi:hypothetical protein